jgi:hypothetical protein
MTKSTHPLNFFAGPKALEQIRAHGLRAQDVAIVPAAAGGPKGLIFQSLDQWLFGHWLPAAPRERTLIGASIGAWRMAAACHTDPVAAFERMGRLYCEQTYSAKPTPREVTNACIELLDNFIGGHEDEIVHHPHYHLHLLTVRGRRLLRSPRHKLSAMSGFAAATLSNLAARSSLAQHMERVIIGDQRDPAFWLKAKFDAFPTHFAALRRENIAAALLASGTLPLIMEPVREIPHAPPGTYWDGGLIDYHLALPYSRVAGDKAGGLVLYPHFTEHIVPGWLDKAIPWRRAAYGRNSEWLDNVLIVAPSQAFLQTLSRSRLPDRQDFHYYGQDHAFRMQNWKLAISEGQHLRDDFAAFVERPDIGRIQPI